MSALVLPTVDHLNRRFWQGCAVGELRLQRCLDCGLVRYPVSAVCPRCLSARGEWRTMSGVGEILSMVVFHRVYNGAWEDRVPYNVVLVQLDEGPRMLSNILPFSRRDLPAGTRVHAVFDPAAGGIRIPRFVPDGHLPA